MFPNGSTIRLLTRNSGWDSVAAVEPQTTKTWFRLAWTTTPSACRQRLLLGSWLVEAADPGGGDTDDLGDVEGQDAQDFREAKVVAHADPDTTESGLDYG